MQPGLVVFSGLDLPPHEEMAFPFCCKLCLFLQREPATSDLKSNKLNCSFFLHTTINGISSVEQPSFHHYHVHHMEEEAMIPLLGSHFGAIQCYRGIEEIYSAHAFIVDRYNVGAYHLHHFLGLLVPPLDQCGGVGCCICT